MKKQILILTISLLTIFKGISQTSDSVTCIPNSQLKKAINLIERGKVMEQEIKIHEKNAALLDKQILKQEEIIGGYQKKDSISQEIITKYQITINNFEQTIKNFQQQVQIQKKNLRRQKLKKWGTLILGIGAGYVIFN